ncbi:MULTISPECIES: ATP phosphoribosyltransferase [unclassified Nocardia]|uniref:ATP phosphoribosyltransferase n=1 Tax=unclassified Nocardia TaxID=2637762 RepID=UPI001CE44D2B|nr:MULTISPECIES: ATP phosphoribosyltransferase [unclassified Nocardia]
MIRLAVPGGRLWPHSLQLLHQLGITDVAGGRRYVFASPAADMQVLVLKVPDIPVVVDEGLVDLAVASDEWLAEHSGRYVSLIPLCWYHIRICVLAPEPDTATRGGADSWRRTIATPYPRLAARLLGPRARIRPVAGAVEAYPGRITDLAIDCVETGVTAASNGLRVVRELWRGDVRLVASPHTDLTNPTVREVISALHATVVDRDCRYGQQPQTAGQR